MGNYILFSGAGMDHGNGIQNFLFNFFFFHFSYEQYF